MMSSAPLTYVFVIMAAYLLGSVPFGLILTRLAGKGDIRSIGSGNIGATNVLRTGSKTLAALTLILDAGKGAAITLSVAAYADITAMALAGCTAVIGHCFPIWLKMMKSRFVICLGAIRKCQTGSKKPWKLVMVKYSISVLVQEAMPCIFKI